MSIRSRLALVVAAAALVLGTAACSGGASQTPSSEATPAPDVATACAAMSAFATAVAQFEGVDVAAIGPENLAPQINRLRGTYAAVESSLMFVDAPSKGALAESWATFETALGAVDQAAPTQEQVDAAKAAAGDVKTNFAKVQTELGCPAS